MKLNIQFIYTQICLSLLKVLDPFKKPIGRPNKYTYDFYIKHILNILTSGLSWNKLSSIISINTDLIRKKYIKWCKLGLFTKANEIILSQYKKKYNHNCLYIDSTNIANFTGKLDFGYNIKIKNKRSIKISTLVDINKVPYILDISKGSIHDAKIMESIIDTKFKNTKDIIEIVGDKGYIKNSSYIENIKTNKNIILITPNRYNSKNKTELNYIQQLKSRYKVEHFFSLLKRGYKRISTINDKTYISYFNFLNIATSIITLNIFTCL